jgi:PST family polysaccharide transporter
LGPERQKLYTRAVKGSVVNAVSSIAQLAIGFGGSVILARILDPADFGIFAFAFIFIAVFDGLSSFQTQSYVIQSKEDARRTVSVGFTLELIASVVVVAILVLTCPLFLKAFDRTQQILFTQVFAVMILLRPFRVARASFVKELSFVPVSVSLLAALAIGTALKIALAWQGHGPWALMIGTLAVLAIEVVMIWALTPIRPTLSLDRSILGPMVRFGAPLVLATLLIQVWMKMGDFMVGNVLDDYWLGVYYLAYRIPYFLMILGQSVVQAGFPALSKAKDRAQLSRGFKLATKMTFILFCVPATICVVWAWEIIDLLYGDKWIGAATPFRVFVCVPLVHFTLIHFGDLYKTQGRTKEAAFILLGQVVFLAVAGYFLLQEFRLMGIALAVLVAELAPLPIISRLVNRYVDISYIRVLWRPALAAAASVAVGLLIENSLGRGVWDMVIGAAVQLGVFIGGIAALEKRDMGRITSELWRLLKRQS